MKKWLVKGLVIAALLVVLVWFVNQSKTVRKPAPAGSNLGKDPIVTLTIDDPGMEFNPGGPAFSPDTMTWGDYPG